MLCEDTDSIVLRNVVGAGRDMGGPRDLVRASVGGRRRAGRLLPGPCTILSIQRYGKAVGAAQTRRPHTNMLNMLLYAKRIRTLLT